MKPMLAIEVRIKKDISLWVKKVKMPGTRTETAGVRGVYLVWMVTSDQTLSRSTRARIMRRRSRKRWSHRKGRQARRQDWSLSSVRRDASMFAREYRGNKDQLVIVTVGKHGGRKVEVQKTDRTSRDKCRSCPWALTNRSKPWRWVCREVWTRAEMKELRSLQNSGMVTPEGVGNGERKWNKEPVEKHDCSGKRSAMELTLFERRP